MTAIQWCGLGILLFAALVGLHDAWQIILRLDRRHRRRSRSRISPTTPAANIPAPLPNWK